MWHGVFWLCRIAFGVVLAGIGPTAEPLIQILETANEVIMRLVTPLCQSAHVAVLIGLCRASLLMCPAQFCGRRVACKCPLQISIMLNISGACGPTLPSACRFLRLLWGLSQRLGLTETAALHRAPPAS